MPDGIGGWDNGISIGEGRLGEKNLVILMNEVREERREHSIFCTTETGGIGFGRTEGEILICSQLKRYCLQ